MSSSSFRGLRPWLRPWAEALLYYFPQLKVTSVYRSYSAQLRLYNTRAKNPYPVAPPGRSMHQLGRAWDMTGPDDVLDEAGAVWKSWGGTWSSRDRIHFEA